MNQCLRGVYALVVASLFFGCGSDKAPGDEQRARETKVAEEVPDGLTPEQARKVVAKVGAHTITVGDVTRQINRLSPYIRRRWAAPDKRKEFLDKLIRVELLSQEAERLGLDQDPEVQRSVKQMMIRVMISNDLEKNLLPTSIEEGALKAEYDKEHGKYHRPAQLRASHIVVAKRADAVRLLSKLKGEKADLGRTFRAAARAKSIDEESRGRGGDIGYFSLPGERRLDEPEVPKAVAEAAWKAGKAGELVPDVIASDAGFHIVMVTNKKPEMSRTFDSVKKSIEDRLLREKRKETLDEFIAGLRGKAQVQLFPKNLSQVKVEGGHSHGGSGAELRSKGRESNPQGASRAKERRLTAPANTPAS